MQRFGLIGHGAVGSLLARLLREHGAGAMSYDLLLDREETAPAARKRIEADGAHPGTLAEMLDGSDCVLAAVPGASATGVAERAASHLRPDHLYIDLASTPPSVKQEIAAAIGAAGARFVEGVILGAVGASSACPAILLGGAHAAGTAEMLARHGLRARFYSGEIGRASAFKMIRSVFAKGMEALLIETLLGARRAGIAGDIWEEIRHTLGESARPMLETWVRSHATSAERRYVEVREVGRFLEGMGLEPVLTRAAAAVFRRSTELGIAERFGREPADFMETIEFLDRESQV